MVAKPLRTKPKSASADRCLRSLGATIDMATPDMETSNCSCERRIVAWRFTKRQPGGRGDYWVLSLSGNCCPRVEFRDENPEEVEGGVMAVFDPFYDLEHVLQAIDTEIADVHGD